MKCGENEGRVDVLLQVAFCPFMAPGEVKLEESASHHVRSVSKQPGSLLEAREGRSSELLEAPEAPRDDPNGSK